MTTPGPWKTDGEKVWSGEGWDLEYVVLEMMSGPQADADARLLAAAPELRDSLKEVTGWLEGSDMFRTNHGAHTAAVEALKLLARLEDEA